MSSSSSRSDDDLDPEYELATLEMSKPDEDARLLKWVYRRSLTTVETDAQRLRRKNAKTHRIAIEESEREAAKAAAEAVRLAKLKREQDREIRWLERLVFLSDDDDDNLGSSSYDSAESPPPADSCSCAGDRKGKGSARKW
ncbi:Phosphorylated carbohydrates phosphatase [Hordeum vulgare]|nr:Phosphorylated carbohydrates phosphatase [Hordeum vulgare]